MTPESDAVSATPEIVRPPESPPSPQPEDYPFWGYLDIAVFFGLAIPCLLLGAVTTKFILWALHIHAQNLAMEAVPAQFLGYGFLFFALYLIFRLHYGQPFWRSLRWVRSRPGTGATLLCGFALALGVALLGAALRTPDLDTPMKELLSDRTSQILIAVFAVTLGPLCEELAFRGFLQPVLVRTFGAAGGIVLAAIPFGLLHLSQYGWSWRHGLLITIAGIGFGGMRQLSDSTRNSTIMHAGYNLIFFVALFSEKGKLPTPW